MGAEGSPPLPGTLPPSHTVTRARPGKCEQPRPDLLLEHRRLPPRPLPRHLAPISCWRGRHPCRPPPRPGPGPAGSRAALAGSRPRSPRPPENAARSQDAGGPRWGGGDAGNGHSGTRAARGAWEQRARPGTAQPPGPRALAPPSAPCPLTAPPAARLAAGARGAGVRGGGGCVLGAESRGRNPRDLPQSPPGDPAAAAVWL